MAHIFISYSRKDKKVIDGLAEEIQKAGYEVWIDRRRISGGDQWDEQVANAISECNVFIVALSPSSVTSTSVKEELNFAIEEEKKIVPVIVEMVEIGGALGFRLGTRQRIDLTISSALTELIATLRDSTSSIANTSLRTDTTPEATSLQVAKTKPIFPWRLHFPPIQFVKKLDRTDWGLIGWWILACTASVFVGIAMIAEVSNAMADFVSSIAGDDPVSGGTRRTGRGGGTRDGLENYYAEISVSDGVWFVVNGAACGAFLGLGQWTILRKHFEGANWWILASTAGGAVCAAAIAAVGVTLINAVNGVFRVDPMVDPATTAVLNAVIGAVCGAFLGLGQWTILRKHFEGANWWILASTAGGAVGSVIYGAAADSWPVVLFSTYSLISGITLVWLLQRRKPKST